MKLKLLNAIKKRVANIPSVNSATLEYDESSIYLKKDGTISTMVIQYKGEVYFKSLMSPLITIKVSKNCIYIFNFFRKDFPIRMFEYSGFLNITNCKIMSFNQQPFSPTIFNKIGEDAADKSETNLEDDDMVLFDYEKEKFAGKINRGYNKQRLAYNKISDNGILQKYGKAELETIGQTALSLVRKSSLIKTSLYDKSLSASKTSNLNKPSIDTTSPDIVTPSITTPSFTDQLITSDKPAATSTSVENKERKKY